MTRNRCNKKNRYLKEDDLREGVLDKQRYFQEIIGGKQAMRGKLKIYSLFIVQTTFKTILNYMYESY